MHTTQTPKAMGNQMAEVLQGMQSGFYVPPVWRYAGAHYHPMHADSCSYFVIPSFQATSRDFMQPGMEGCLLAP